MIRVPVYFSHSYRREDRDLNGYFWELFHRAGFSFTVDPVSTALQTTTLELMMARSPGFVAVVTYRPEEQHYQCSPFIVYEYGLAVQSDKPRILLRDKRISPVHFDHRRTIQVAFDRAALPRCEAELRAHLAGFRASTSSAVASRPYRLGSVGFALGADADGEEPPGPVRSEGSRRAVVERLLEDDGDRAVDLLDHAHDPAALAQAADGCDFVIVDLDDERTSRVADFLQGRGTPMLKVARRGTEAALPRRLRGSSALRRAAAADEMVAYWGGVDEFRSQVRSQVSRAAIDRTEFADFDAGYRYFRSLGRKAGPVFVSNAGSTNGLARELAKRLKLENILFFHYRYNNTIGLGSRWASGLDSAIGASKIFVPLIDEDYWRSPYCRHEYELAERMAAQGRLKIVPGVLSGRSGGPVVVYQGEDLREHPQPVQARHLVEHLDNLLTAESPHTVSDVEGTVEAGRFGVDVAVITVLRQEYEAVLALLAGVRAVRGTAALNNQHAWVIGQVDAPGIAEPYTVALALSPRAGTNAAVITTKNTIQAFDPQCVLVVGVAGGLGALEPGDVVVADRIIAYEYGKVDHGFHPRRDLDLPTDAALVAAARTLPAHHPAWYTDLDLPEAVRHLTPRIVVGQVASGEKVIDDPTDSFFASVLASVPELRAVEMEGAGVAAAIQDARESQRAVSFGMIRGICDLPRPGGSGPGSVPGTSTQTELRDTWKGAASITAAAAAVQLLRLRWPRPPRSLAPPD